MPQVWPQKDKKSKNKKLFRSDKNKQKKKKSRKNQPEKMMQKLFTTGVPLLAQQ